MAERLEELVQQLADANIKLSQELQDARAAQTADVNRIIGALGNVANAPPNDAAVHAKNFLQMRKDFRKSQRCKTFAMKQQHVVARSNLNKI